MLLSRPCPCFFFTNYPLLPPLAPSTLHLSSPRLAQLLDLLQHLVESFCTSFRAIPPVALLDRFFGKGHEIVITIRYSSQSTLFSPPRHLHPTHLVSPRLTSPPPNRDLTALTVCLRCAVCLVFVGYFCQRSKSNQVRFQAQFLARSLDSHTCDLQATPPCLPCASPTCRSQPKHFHSNKHYGQRRWAKARVRYHVDCKHIQLSSLRRPRCYCSPGR